MIRAAGILFCTPEGRVLLMHRTGEAEKDGDIRSCWAFPGGGIEGEETAEEAARREIEEETGLKYDGPLKLWTRRIRDEVDFTTFLARVEAEFVPVMNDEHDACSWVDKRFALTSSNLHPGAYIALARFDMDELAVAKAIRDGELTSPQYYGKDMMLIAIRITGTGLSYRSAHKEYVWRDPSIYMNAEFLERCNGLEVIFDHPEKTMLNTEEFVNRIIGTVFVPYQKPELEEIWAIAKIRDMRAAELLETQVMSTSPAVLCLGDKAIVDGNKILFEDKPFLLDHIAVLIPDPQTGRGGTGVWDKGPELKGVESIDARTSPDDDSALDSIMKVVMRQKIDEVSRRADGL